MLRRDLGLTKLYNLVNDPDYTDDDIVRMRESHVELVHAVMDAYDWATLSSTTDSTATGSSAAGLCDRPLG